MATHAKTPKAAERQFRVSFTVGEKRLGTVLADINGAPGLQVDLIKDHDAGKNLPKGTVAQFILEFLKGGPKELAEVRDAVRGQGYGNNTVYSTLSGLIKAKKITRRVNTFTLKG